DQRLLAAVLGSHQTTEEDAARVVLHERHLAVLWNRVEARQLAGREYIFGQRVARRGAEVLVLELIVDRTRDSFEVLRTLDGEAAEQQSAMPAQAVARPV